MAYNTQALDELSQKLGIYLSFIDRGTNTEYLADKKSKQTICEALGFPSQTDEQVQKSLQKLKSLSFADFAPQTLVFFEYETQPVSFELSIRKEQEFLPVSWVLTREDGTVQSGHFLLNEMPCVAEEAVNMVIFQKRKIYLHLDVGIGYHSLTFLINDEKPISNASTKLIIAPKSCYLPDVLKEGKRVYGFPLQLYALKSHHNFGMGDFSDLSQMAEISNELGATLVGINPVNALFLDSPQDASPYSASSRLFLNPLYVDTDEAQEAQDNQLYETYKKSVDFQKKLKEATDNNQVQYQLISEMKMTAFQILFEKFSQIHINEQGEALTDRGEAFLSFCQKWNPFLLDFATFQVIRNVFSQEKKSLLWWRWEKEFLDAQSDKIRSFQKKHKKEISCILYQQFLAFEQYAKVAQKFCETGMKIGLYTDLPVGVGENSAEVWSNQDVFMQNVTTGAPPDIFNKKGQDWALSPFHPMNLKKSGYELFIRVLRSVMQNAGAVRIDHAFGLMRLYLRVKEAGGAYLSYPFKEMMGIVALESVRNRCLVIAEDLGTAPDGFHEEMLKVSALSFKIFHHQRNWDGLIMPQNYEQRCLIASGTHDLPSYSAFWKGLDLELAKKMKTISLKQYTDHKNTRIQERRQFLEAFQKQGLQTPPFEEWDSVSIKTVPKWFIPDVYEFLARTNSMILLVRFEDIIEQDDQINLPGTYLEYPNWRHKLPVFIDSLLTDERVLSVCNILKKERPL